MQKFAKKAKIFQKINILYKKSLLLDKVIFDITLRRIKATQNSSILFTSKIVVCFFLRLMFVYDKHKYFKTKCQLVKLITMLTV